MGRARRPLYRARGLSYAVVATTWLIGCSLLVPSSLPDYRCSGADPSVCPEGMVCDTVSLLCVAPTDIVPPELDASEDAAPHPEGVGGNCINDDDCSGDLLCGTSTLLTTAIVTGNSKPVCTRPCCASADCPTGFVCFATGTGGNYCVSAEKAGRTPEAGGKGGGLLCQHDTDCRSGLCESGRCVDTCCNPDQCSNDSTCRVGRVANHVAWICASSSDGGKALGEACGSTVECENENCVQPFSSGYRCTPPCCSTLDCARFGFENNVCAYGQAGTDYLKWCFEANTGGKELGAECQSNADCASRYCDNERGRCANVCCTSDDCANDETCQPSLAGTPYLRCVPAK